MLDFSRAFDTVPHKKLLFKLNKYGINGRITKWIQSLLMHKKQEVIVEGESTKPMLLNLFQPMDHLKKKSQWTTPTFTFLLFDFHTEILNEKTHYSHYFSKQG